MRIFVTGATGFIGSHLVMRLASEGNLIHAIYRTLSKTNEIAHENIKWFCADLMDLEGLEKAMQGCEQVYHIAALATVWENEPGDFRKHNVQGTVNILTLARKLGIKSIVFTSTAGVFGPSFNKEITEESISKLKYFTNYESSKAECEKLITSWVVKGLRIVIVNPTRVYGPGILNESNSVTKMVIKYLNGKWYFIPGNGKSIGNYVYVDDVVNGHILAMKKGKAGERYILGGENVSYNYFFDTIIQISNKRFPLFRLPLFLMLGFANFLILLNNIFRIKPVITPAHIRKFNYNWIISSQKSKNELGYTITNLYDGLLKTIKWINQE